MTIRPATAQQGVNTLLVRIDLWLCAARFYKTRSLARQAIDAGKVQVNGLDCKPARTIGVGDRVGFARGEERWALDVTGVSERRGSASVAATLYRELDDSRAAREKAREHRRLVGPDDGRPASRPDRKARRLIRSFKNSL